MPFLLPVEQQAAVNKAESVLKEQALSQATLQHRVSTQSSLTVKGVFSVATLDTNDYKPVPQDVAAWKKMTLNEQHFQKENGSEQLSLHEVGCRNLLRKHVCSVVLT